MAPPTGCLVIQIKIITMDELRRVERDRIGNGHANEVDAAARSLLKRGAARSASAGRLYPDAYRWRSGAWLYVVLAAPSACTPPSDQDLAELWRDCDGATSWPLGGTCSHLKMNLWLPAFETVATGIASLKLHAWRFALEGSVT